MKYYRCTEGDAGGTYQFWSYYELSDSSESDDATEMYLDENPWHRCPPAGLRIYTEEISSEFYHEGKLFNNYYNSGSSTARIMLKENIFPVKQWAVLFASKNKPVCIGYPNCHQVYRMNDNRELSYQYDYNAGKFGILTCFEKVYPV